MNFSISIYLLLRMICNKSLIQHHRIIILPKLNPDDDRVKEAYILQCLLQDVALSSAKKPTTKKTKQRHVTLMVSL